MVRLASPDLMKELINLALTAEDERVKAACLMGCLDRAGLKPMDYDPSSEKQAVPLDFSRLNAEQRAQMRELLEAMKAPESE
jgi:hypothetical protein